jgi:hypothetical protein
MWWAIGIITVVAVIVGAAAAFIGIFIGVGISERSQDRLDGRFN